jgi:hypothetical protein
MLGQVEPKCVLLLKVLPSNLGRAVGVSGKKGSKIAGGVRRATWNRFMLSYCNSACVEEIYFVLWLL